MVLITSDAIGIPAPAHALDKEKLLEYLKRNNRDFPDGCNSIGVFKFSHGQSNPTYLLEAQQHRYVLRKKPPGQVLTSAHAVDREFRILYALHNTPVPVPRVLCCCEDGSVIGSAFYVMEHVNGRIFVDPGMPEVSPSERSAAYHSMARTLAALHSVDPAAVGLQDYGKPTGYCKRQVWRWSKQYMAQLQDPPLPEMKSLIAWLETHVPSCDNDPAQARLSHGDFRLDNMVFGLSAPMRVEAVLDWELSTIGPPWADLAYCCMAYHLPQGFSGLPVLGTPLPPGIPTESQFIDWYCTARGIQPPDSETWVFFMALSLFRIAAILAGVGARAKMGNASSDVAARVGSVESVSRLASCALQLIAASPPPTPPPSGPPAQVLGDATEGLGNRGGAGLEPSPRVKNILEKLKAFMAAHVLPNEPELYRHMLGEERWSVHPLMEQMKAKAKQEGLWNLWIPQNMADIIRNRLGSHVQGCQLGAGLTNLEYAFLSEYMGRCVWASEVFNCSAPDTGNMEVLSRYGSVQQQRRWLVPLLEGSIRSCFAMTEPQVASSDARNIGCSIVLDGSEYAVSGHKWWISGAADPRCAVALVMGKTNPAAAPHAQQSIILVPMNQPGVKIIRPLLVYGYDDAPHGHVEMTFSDVRVPAENIVLGEGRGFEIAQGRLGPGRLHHCMRAIGMGNRAYEIMAQRALNRTVFGSTIARHGAFQSQLATAHLKLESARLMVLSAAHALDLKGNKEARGKIASAKVYAPRMVLEVIDTAVQVCGAAGVGSDLPLSYLWVQARTLRIADGPDDVHLASIAKLELKRIASKL